jgi:hypothetical protein
MLGSVAIVRNHVSEEGIIIIIIIIIRVNEAIGSSGTSVLTKAKPCNIPKDGILASLMLSTGNGPQQTIITIS